MSELVVQFPPGDDESGKLLCFACESCGAQADGWGSFKVDNFDHTATCPECGKLMKVDLSGFNLGIKGTWSSNRRRAKDLTQRNEKMKTKQWDNHDVGVKAEDVRSGRRKFRNATSGGPLDLNSKFHKRTR